jgi:hypothetical protein
MKTANDVIEAIDETIDLLERSAVGPLTEAFDGFCDRETYREATRRAAELAGIKRLRKMLVDRIEQTPPPAVTSGKPRKRRATKTK